MNRDKDHTTLSWRLLLCGRPRRVKIVHAGGVAEGDLGLFVHGPALRSMEANDR
jgi:hypothetical protein